ncbi:Ribonuclease H1 [Nymphon striatum]|nr:Ribonuclease H1 [Nymphon striatum]
MCFLKNKMYECILSRKECEMQIKGFKGAVFKKFLSEIEANDFIGGNPTCASVPLQNIPKSISICNSRENSKDELKHENCSRNVMKLKGCDRTFIDIDPAYLQASVPQKCSNSFGKLATSLNQTDEQGILSKVEIIQNNDENFVETNEINIDASTQTENKVQALEETVFILKRQLEATNAKLAEITAGNRCSKRRKSAATDCASKSNSVAGAPSTVESSPVKKCHVYTDGACQDNGKPKARAGIGIYWGPDHPYNTSARLPGRQTNNRAEIQPEFTEDGKTDRLNDSEEDESEDEEAAVVALYQSKSQNINDIVLYTDSKFLIESATKWMHGWKKKNWTLSKGGPVKNKDDFIDLEEAMEGINVEWVYVQGHAGIHGNEMADQLAVKGISEPLP